MSFRGRERTVSHWPGIPFRYMRSTFPSIRHYGPGDCCRSVVLSSSVFWSAETCGSVWFRRTLTAGSRGFAAFVCQRQRRETEVVWVTGKTGFCPERSDRTPLPWPVILTPRTRIAGTGAAWAARKRCLCCRDRSTESSWSGTRPPSQETTSSPCPRTPKFPTTLSTT